MAVLDFLKKLKSPDSTRAPRFQVQIPLHFRAPGDFGWNIGKTENISRSSVLFQTGKLLNLGTPIEMRFTVPPDIMNKAGGLVACRGKVVRTVTPTTPHARASFAVRILHCRFAHDGGDSYV